MKAFIVTTIDAYLIYLLLTVGSGNFLYFWPMSELIMGLFLALIVGAVAGVFHRNLDSNFNHNFYPWSGEIS